MGVVKTPDITPGMVLAEDLLSPQGRLLVSEGSTLKKEHLRIIKIWGVREANIVCKSRRQENTANFIEIDPELFTLSDEYVSRYLSCFDLEHEAMSELYRLCLKRTTQHLAEGYALPEKVSSSASKNNTPVIPAPPQKLTPQELVGDITSQKPFPSIYFQINDLLNSPGSTSARVAKAIAQAPGLAEALLALVNSPLYAFPARIKDLKQAVSIMGADELNTLLLGLSVFAIFKNTALDPLYFRQFWEHAIFCGCVAKLLAGLLPGITIERFFVAGLLHDIGKLPMVLSAPEQATLALEYARKNLVTDCEAEQYSFGCDHTQTGELLLQEWMFPNALIRIARFHHTPMQAEHTLEPTLVHLADIISLVMDTATAKPHVVPPLAQDAWDFLGFPAHVLEPIIMQAEQQTSAIAKIFLKEADAA